MASVFELLKKIGMSESTNPSEPPEFIIVGLGKYGKTNGKSHPETAGTIGWCKTEPILIEDIEERKAFIDYVCDFEYNKFSIPKPDKVIFLDMPICIHDREAHEDTLRLLKKYRPKGVLHCFSGSVEMAKEIIKLGMYIGLGGAVTFKNAVKPCEVAKFVPNDRLLIETDAPYMTPVPFRGKRCDSLHIPYTAEKIAELRGCTAQEILDLTDRNARILFNIR